MPAFHAILVVREEGDIIAQTLAHLLTWCDRLYVYDTGSTDSTWEIVRDVAARDRRVVAVGSEPVLFNDTLRAWLFERHRGEFRPGDWIARVDADEFYLEPPPTFVAERVRAWEGRVCSCMYDFLLSRGELKAWQDGQETVADRSRPIRERRRYFRFDEYAEQRLFRYRRGMRWVPGRFDPEHGGLTAPERIPILHYRARDPLQVQVRCAIREPTKDAVDWAAWHWSIADWRAWVFAENDPTMVHWRPGERLPEHPNRFMEFGRWRRTGERVFYGSGAVRVRDALRRRFPGDWSPTPMDPMVQERIQANLANIRERPYLKDLPLQVEVKRARMRAGLGSEGAGAAAS
jgi:glycosyltransferase involved in cell wall biosynthesis